MSTNLELFFTNSVGLQVLFTDTANLRHFFHCLCKCRVLGHGSHFSMADQVESARTMAFFSADLEEPSAAVVRAMVNRTTAAIGQTKLGAQLH